MVNNTKIYKLVLVISFLALIIGCEKKLLPLEYKQWAESEDSGLSKSKIINPIEFKVQFLKPEYKLLINKGPVEINNIDIEKELLEYEKDYSFAFTMKNLNGIPPLRYQLYDENEYFSRIEYMNNNVTKDFYLLTSKSDTLKCLFAHMERDFGISPELRLQVSFGDIVEGEDIQFCYNDNMLRNGMIKFKFYWEDLTKSPKLIKG